MPRPPLTRPCAFELFKTITTTWTKRKRRLDSLEAAQGAPRDPRRGGRGDPQHGRDTHKVEGRTGPGLGVPAGVLSPPAPPQEGRPFPRAHPETAALLQQRWVGLQEGTAAVLVLRHGHRAQVNKIKAVAWAPARETGTQGSAPTAKAPLTPPWATPTHPISTAGVSSSMTWGFRASHHLGSFTQAQSQAP